MGRRYYSTHDVARDHQEVHGGLPLQRPSHGDADQHGSGALHGLPRGQGDPLERIALDDEHFIKRKLYPNVDFYSVIIYQAMGFRPEMFTALFAIPRTAGWLAQWQEMITDPEQKIARPRQVWTGQEVREFVPLTKRVVLATTR